MVLNPAVTRLAATAGAPDPASFRRTRNAVDENRARRLKTDPSFPCFSTGGFQLPGQPVHDFRSSLPFHFRNIFPTAGPGVTESVRTVIRCLSGTAARRHDGAAGPGRAADAIRSRHSHVRNVRFHIREELRRTRGDSPGHSTERLIVAAFAVVVSTGWALAGRQRTICVPVYAPVLTALFNSSPIG